MGCLARSKSQRDNAAVVILAYDALPPGSDIRIEQSPELTRITVPGTDLPRMTVPPDPDVPRAVTKQAALDALARGAIHSCPLLVLALIVFYFGIRANRISGATLMWAWGFFAIFCAAIVALIVWVRYGMLMEALRHGRQQMTVIAATQQRLLIETAGPFGVMSLEMPTESIVSLRSVVGRLGDRRERSWTMRYLSISWRDGRRVLLLPGRDPAELQTVIACLKSALGRG
jgi:hypothetical protein